MAANDAIISKALAAQASPLPDAHFGLAFWIALIALKRCLPVFFKLRVHMTAAVPVDGTTTVSFLHFWATVSAAWPRPAVYSVSLLACMPQALLAP